MAFPSEWEGETIDSEHIKISYRYGEIKIFLDDVLKVTTDKSDIDVGGYMEDEELKEVLVRDKLVAEEEQETD